MKEGIKGIDSRMLDEGSEISEETFKKLQQDFELKSFTSEIEAVDKIIESGDDYVFATLDNKVAGIGKFIGKNRVSGEYVFKMESDIPDGKYCLIVHGTLSITMEAKNQEFYFIHNGSYVGNAMMWWGKDGAGYTSNIEEAGYYTKEHALRIHNNRKTDIPYLASSIKSVKTSIVDSQKVKSEFRMKGL